MSGQGCAAGEGLLAVCEGAFGGPFAGVAAAMAGQGAGVAEGLDWILVDVASWEETL